MSVPPAILQRGSGAPLDSSAVGYATLQSWALEKGAISGNRRGGGGGNSPRNGSSSATIAATMAMVEASEQERGQSQRRQRRRKVPTLAQYLQVDPSFMHSFFHPFIYAFIRYITIHRSNNYLG